jgi:hypothetical protein
MFLFISLGMVSFINAEDSHGESDRVSATVDKDAAQAISNEQTPEINISDGDQSTQSYNNSINSNSAATLPESPGEVSGDLDTCLAAAFKRTLATDPIRKEEEAEDEEDDEVGDETIENTIDEVVSTATYAERNFYVKNEVEFTENPTYSYILTHNRILGVNASFTVLDANSNGNIYKCDNVKRRRRIKTTQMSDNPSDPKMVARNLELPDEWGLSVVGEKVGGENGGHREAYYFFKAGQRHFSVGCTVGKRVLFFARRNKDCTAESTVAPSSPNRIHPDVLRTCKVSSNISDQSQVTDFIEKAINQRLHYLKKRKPSNVESWKLAIHRYDLIKNHCGNIVGSDRSAKNSIRELGKAMNNSINKYKRKNPSAPIAPVVVPN